MDHRSSLSLAVKLVLLSEQISFTWPLPTINLRSASRKESVSKLWTTSICTAQIAKQVKIIPYGLTRLRARQTWKGPKQSTPTVVKGGWSGVRRSSGRSAIFCSRTGAWRRWQLTHLDRILLTAELPLITQNCSRKRLKTYSLPKWPEIRWKCSIKSWTRDHSLEGWFDVYCQKMPGPV